MDESQIPSWSALLHGLVVTRALDSATSVGPARVEVPTIGGGPAGADGYLLRGRQE